MYVKITISVSNVLFLIFAILAVVVVYYEDESAMMQKFTNIYTESDLTFSSGKCLVESMGASIINPHSTVIMQRLSSSSDSCLPW
jgi:hypothetical protein